MAKKRFSHTITYLTLILIFLGVSLVRDLDPATESVEADTLRSTAEARVVDVVDGDTLTVEQGEDTLKVRLIGIDTPETRRPGTPVECFGKEASAQLERLVLGKSVRLLGDPTQSEVDRYGRTLAYVYRSDGMFVNLEMLSGGYAFEYTYGTPYEQQKVFFQAQQQAREQGVGLWNPAICNGKR